MKMNPYLWFNGNCEEAFKVYEKCFGGKIEAMLTHKGMPSNGQTLPNWEDKIMHAMMIVQGQMLMASDLPPDSYKAPVGMHVSVHIDDQAETEKVFATLAEGGQVSVPLHETFWAWKFGELVDRFGTPWIINCPKPMDRPAS